MRGFYKLPLLFWYPWKVRKQEVQTGQVQWQSLACWWVWVWKPNTSFLPDIIAALSPTPLSLCLLLQILYLELFLVLILTPGLDALGYFAQDQDFWVPFEHSFTQFLLILLDAATLKKVFVSAFHSLLRVMVFSTRVDGLWTMRSQISWSRNPGALGFQKDNWPHEDLNKHLTDSGHSSPPSPQTNFQQLENLSFSN